MNILNYLTGTAKEATDVIGKGPQPTELELSLRQMHADHLAAMQAIKSLTEIAVNQTTRAVDQVALLRNLKRTITASEGKHLAAFELSQRPLLRAVEELDKKLTNKLSKMDADIHALRVDLNCDREAQARIQNTKLNAIAERIDTLVKILANDLIKHPEGVTVAPPKRKPGRRSGDKNRTPEERYKFLSHRLQVARPDSNARAEYMSQLVELRKRMGMALMSDRALGKEVK